tara:strand:- start:796 stop:1056 length:261 start_codon:yes stop_codon:yes gene_type:complete
MKNSLDQILDYARLGYEISFTIAYGHEMILMKKAYSHPAEQSLISEQIFSHEDAREPQSLHSILGFLYKDIQSQEETGIYRKRLKE